jgi:hypothetical protein
MPEDEPKIGPMVTQPAQSGSTMATPVQPVQAIGSPTKTSTLKRPWGRTIQQDRHRERINRDVAGSARGAAKKTAPSSARMNYSAAACSVDALATSLIADIT